MTAGMGIYDAMQFVEAYRWDGVYGFGSEYGSILLTAGEKAKEIVHAERENYDSPAIRWCQWSCRWISRFKRRR